MGVFWHGQFCFPLQRAGQGLVVGGGARDGSCCRDDDMEKSRPPLLLLIAFGIFAWPCTTYTTTAPGHTHTHSLTHTHSHPLTRKTCLHLCRYSKYFTLYIHHASSSAAANPQTPLEIGVHAKVHILTEASLQPLSLLLPTAHAAIVQRV